LGKIFENLLASYNPETQTTARKQTGSFYTPREIVNYMVDESLITYLENALIGFYENPTLKQSSSTLDKNLFGEAKPKQAKLDITHSKINVEQKEEINKRLRHLLSYSEEEPFFNDEERLFLIHAIDDCNILDPACGSGAFPMGVLHKMVHILQKLDHDNEKWKELQRRKAIADTESAYKIGDNDEREKRLLEINDVFENNSSDYGRKLFLIENCIYGVDIQTIAVQIAKLRFFISLVIDQRKQDNADNFGIRSLPNLETKFVAANTLIALDIPAQLKIEDEELKELKTALREVRHEYFRAKNRNDKKRFQKNDKKIRDAIGENIKKELEEYEKSLVSKINIKEKELELSLKASPIKLPAKDAEKHKRSIEKLKREIEELKSGLLDSKSIDSLAYQISGWDPYDQNTSSGWFDAEWMFGVKKGFDIVIGNPPYIDIKGLPKDDVKLYFQIFKTTENRINLYSIFIEKGISLLNLNGILAYINPNSILINESYTKIRKHIVEGVERIIKLPDSVFVAATVETIILLSKRKSSNENILGVYFANNDKIDFTNLMFNSFSREEWRSDVDSRFNIFGDVKVTTLLKKINNNSSPLEKYVLSSLGITPYDKYKGHSEKLINNREFHSPTKISKHYVPLISGKNIHPFYISDEIDEYLKYGDWLGAPREKKFFENPKIIVRQIVGGNELKIIAGYSESPRYFTQIGFSLISKTDSTDTLKFILGLLNSSLINFYHRNKFLDTEKIVFQKILIANCKQLPIKEPIELKPFIKIVDKILTAKRNSKVTNTLEDEFDLMVYKLYNLTFEEVKIIEPKFAMSKEEYDNLSAIEAERVEASPIDNLQKKKRKGRGFDHEAIGKLFD
jgi:hypothetical protein